MIDLLLALAALACGFLFLTRHFSPVKRVLAAAALAAVAHGACLIALYSRDAGFLYVVAPSPAQNAGLRGPGKVQSLDGEQVASLGEFLGKALAREQLNIQAGTEFLRYAPDHQRFWAALDSYTLEEASGGLAFFPRRPVATDSTPAVILGYPPFRGKGTRVISAGSVETPTIVELLAELEKVPPKGIHPLRLMQSSTDSGVRTVYFSPSAYSLEGVDPRDAIQHALGLSGLPFFFLGKLTDRFFFVHWTRHGAVYGPAGMRAVADSAKKEGGVLPTLFANSQEKMALRVQNKIGAFLRPRLSLLPWLHESPWLSYPAGVAGAYVRQVLNLPNLNTIRILRPTLPRPFYLLDDPIQLPSFFFRLASLFTSLALASLAFVALPLLPAVHRRMRRAVPLVALGGCMVLQLADLFVVWKFIF